MQTVHYNYIKKLTSHNNTFTHTKDSEDMHQHSSLDIVPVGDFSFTLYPIFSTFTLENVHCFYDEKLNFITKKKK